MSDVSFDISTKELAKLVKPVMPLAHKDGMLPILNAVVFESAGDYITASATDRYRMGIARAKIDPAPPPGLNIKLGLGELRQLLSVFKSDAKMERTVTITVLDDRIKVEQTLGFGFMDASMSFPLVKGDFPPLAKLLNEAQLVDPSPAVGLNAAHLSDFRHAIREGEPLIVRSAQANKPIIVTAGSHFIGALMPMRTASDTASAAYDSWTDVFESMKPAAETDKAAA